jgi:hypothetical protein
MRIVILIALGMLMCAQASFGQQTPPLFVPYGPSPDRSQYAQQAPQPVQAPQAQPTPRQSRSMYDYTYYGPMNVYGQPVFSMVRRQGQDGQAPQNVQNGIIPQAARELQGLGTYLWSYMPAPLTGATSPYDVPRGAGHVSISYVPGSPR